MRKVLGLAGLMLAACFNSAHAENCSAPPFGATPGAYQAFREAFGPVFDDPHKFMRSICEAKFGLNPAALDTMHRLGFNDTYVANHSC